MIFEKLQYTDYIKVIGSGGGNRTPDTRIMIPQFISLNITVFDIKSHIISIL